MPILKSDIDELRRLVTNTYNENDKKFLNRVIAGIFEMEREIVRLKADLDKAVLLKQPSLKKPNKDKK
jgi:hypothetical protein